MYFAGGYDAYAAYAAVHYRLRAKDCPPLSQIAQGPLMQVIAGKARASVASGLPPSNWLNLMMFKIDLRKLQTH